MRRFLRELARFLRSKPFDIGPPQVSEWRSFEIIENDEPIRFVEDQPDTFRKPVDFDQLGP